MILAGRFTVHTVPPTYTEKPFKVTEGCSVAAASDDAGGIKVSIRGPQCLEKICVKAFYYLQCNTMWWH